MKRALYLPAVCALHGLLFVGAASVVHAQITTYSDRPTFDLAVGPTTVETFTDNFHFPITTGTLNSATNLVVANGSPILPGDIKSGVTYSTPIGSDFFFNIDAGGGYTGGFLDRVGLGFPSTALTITFDGPVSAFAFDTEDLMRRFRVGINYSGTPYSDVFSGAGFYGFQSGNQDITGLTIFGADSSFAFDIDNFTFTKPGSTSVPEPGSMGLLAAASLTGGLVAVRRLRQRRR